MLIPQHTKKFTQVFCKMSGPGGDRFTVIKANESAPIGEAKQDGYGAAGIEFSTDQKKGEL